MAESVAVQVAKMLVLALGKLGAPYLWWAKGEEYGALVGSKFKKLPVAPLLTTRSPSGLVVGCLGKLAFDCSGFVLWLYWKVSGVDYRWTHNTDKLWNELPEVKLDEVQPGDLAFYGGNKPDDVSHVMLVLSVVRLLGVVQVVVIGSSGGGRATTTPKEGACVKVYQTHLYRRDFRGFRGSPLRYPF